MLFSCFHCKTDLDVTPELSAETVQCPACQGRFQLPAINEKASSSGAARPQREGWQEKITPTWIPPAPDKPKPKFRPPVGPKLD